MVLSDYRYATQILFSVAETFHSNYGPIFISTDCKNGVEVCLKLFKVTVLLLFFQTDVIQVLEHLQYFN